MLKLKNSAWLCLLVGALSFATSSYTPNYQLNLPQDGDVNWGSGYRSNLTTIDNQMFINATGLSNHLADPTAAHAASAISAANGVGLCTTSTNVQAWLTCLQNSIAPVLAGGAASLAGNNIFTGSNVFNGAVTLGSLGVGILHTTGGPLTASAVNLTSDVSNVLPTANGGTGLSSPSTSGNVLTSNGSAWVSSPPATSGTVTSVALTSPGILYTISGSPVTSSGTLALNLINQNANTVLAGPSSGGAATPAFRVLVGADLPTPGASSLGGVQSYAAVTHQWINAVSTSGLHSSSQPAFSDISGTATGAQLPNPSASTLGGVQSAAPVSNQWINSISTSGVPALSQPAFSNISGTASLTSQVTGVLPLANGGTNANLTAANGAIPYSTGSALALLAPGTSGQVLTSGGAAAPTWTSPLVNPMTTGGDIIYGGSAGAATRLANGSSGQFLQSAGGTAAPMWAGFISPEVTVLTSGSGTWNRTYVFTITSGNATVGATYTNNSITYTVLHTVASATQVRMSGSGAPTASGTLTKASGTGDATLSFSLAASAIALHVRALGGGGGSGGSANNGSTGGNGGAGGQTTFGTTLLVANGGAGGTGGSSSSAAGGNSAGTASLGTGVTGIAVTGNPGGNGISGISGISEPGGMGGSGPFGGAGIGSDGLSASGGAAAGTSGAANSGSGGGGAGAANGRISGGGGQAGGFADGFITGSNLAATFAYSIGTGGSAGSLGTGGSPGNGGGSGVVSIEEDFQ